MILFAKSELIVQIYPNINEEYSLGFQHTLESNKLNLHTILNFMYICFI